MAEKSNLPFVKNQATVSSGRGGILSISIEGGICTNMNGAELHEIYRCDNTVEEILHSAISNVLGGKRSDQKVRLFSQEYLHVLVECSTDDRFLDVLAYCESGNIKRCLKEEFLKIDLEVKGLNVTFDNLEDVKNRKAKIVGRYGC